jgi:hypothetical protein
MIFFHAMACHGCQDGVFEVKATAGDTHLGGEAPWHGVAWHGGVIWWFMAWHHAELGMGQYL